MSDISSEATTGAINELRLSGVLMSRMQSHQYASGASCLKGLLRCPSRGGKSSFHIGVTIWINQDNSPEVQHAMELQDNASVVVTGSLSINYSNGRNYIDVNATTIE